MDLVKTILLGTSLGVPNHLSFGGESVLIGSIINVILAGYRILTGRFYQNFEQIDQK